MSITRRQFLGLTAIATTNLVIPKDSEASEGKYATIIDLTACDGCKDEPVPLCVKACREYNNDRFPEPQKPIQPYWPRKGYEDWSDKRDRIDTLTPYNWLFVQRINVDGEDLNIPRRCMHCDNPPCVRGCPFGALTKQPEGNSVINDSLCFGGAKCRDVCPWGIPQRQAGVGLYMKLLPKYAGGGVMYKCDLCKDRIVKGQEPACVGACKARLGDRPAMYFGKRDEILRIVKERVEKEGLHVYGDVQNGGTSTFYLSAVAFDKISKAISEKKDRIPMATNVKSKLKEDINPIGKFLIGSTALTVVAAVVGAIASKKDRKEE
ncbi:MAG: 4Fe-4S dicluster domain-containing protein [Thermodesulfovibrionales bacterium]|nr:4Fe-4S dicluster domain-containing protein [Thermodesulfovibrionales bacterium]